MGFRLLENVFLSQKTERKDFYLCPPGKTPQQTRIITSQAKGNYPFPSGSIFLENLFSLCGKGEVEETV